MTLTPTEIRTLTDKARRTDQREWLELNGIPYRQDGERLLVSKTAVDKWLSGVDVPKATGFNLALVK
jgi:hypothetical protein